MGSTTPRNPSQAPARDGTNHAKHLAPLAGRWHFEGRVEGTQEGPAAPWSSEESANWLPGERFLVHQWDARVGDRQFRGMAIFGHDCDHGFFADFYDSAGNHPRYELTIDGPTWHLAGEARRATFEFNADGKSVRIEWELRVGDDWQPLCQLTGTRVTTH